MEENKIPADTEYRGFMEASYHDLVVMVEALHVLSATKPGQAKIFLNEIYLLDGAGYELQAAEKIKRFVRSQMKRNGAVVLNYLLEQVQVSKLSRRCLDRLIRSTADYRAELSSWQSTYQKIREELSLRDEAPINLPSDLVETKYPSDFDGDSMDYGLKKQQPKSQPSHLLMALVSKVSVKQAIGRTNRPD